MPVSPPSPPTLPAGVKRVTKRRPDGSVTYYYYHRTTGARLPDPTAPEFAAAIKAAKAAPRALVPGVGMAGLIAAHRRSTEWQRLAASTRKNRESAFRWLERLEDSAPESITRAHLMDLRDIVARENGDGAANSFLSCTSALFTWAVERGKLAMNPAMRIKMLPGGHLEAWTDAEAALALKLLPEHIRRIVILAIYTGQRRGDLAAMTWDQFDGQALRLRPQKTNRPGKKIHELLIPAHPVLRAELKRWQKERSEGHILVNARGRAWEGNAMSHAFQQRLAKIGITGRNVHGLRKLAATRLAEAGCSTHEIAAITGHATLAMVALYTRSADQQRLAEAAILRLETANGNRRKKRV